MFLKFKSLFKWISSTQKANCWTESMDTNKLLNYCIAISKDFKLCLIVRNIANVVTIEPDDHFNLTHISFLQSYLVTFVPMCGSVHVMMFL